MITTIKITLNDMKIKMIIAEDIVLKNGVILAKKGTIIDEKMYKKLMKTDINQIEICGKKYFPKIKDIKENNNRINQKFSKSKKEVKKTTISIGYGINSDIDKLYNLVLNTMNTLYNKSKVLECLYKLKQTNEDIYTHSLNVGIISNIIGNWLGYDEHKIQMLTISGVLHDIGKIEINDNYITKNSDIRLHPLKGYNLLNKLNFPKEIKDAVYMHHEKIDGSGYPRGLKGKEITDIAKIITICNEYEHMTSKSKIGASKCPFSVISEFQKINSKTLDPELLEVVMQNIAYSYLGNFVMLSTSQKAEIVFINQKNLARPIVRISKEDYINLDTEKDIKIKYVI